MAADPADTRREMLRVAKELTERRGEALRLFAPLPHQQAIHSSKARRLVVRGGNRSGKTLNGAVRLADIVTGNDRGAIRYTKPGKALIVSLDFTLLAKNCYSKLFEPGAFLVCSSCKRVFHKCLEENICGPEEGWKARAEPAPPLIPPRFVQSVAWIDKQRRIAECVYLTTGWQIDLRSCESGREKFQGDQWDVVWIDEEGGSNEDVMNEIERGLMDRSGRMWWTATPLAAGVKLLQYSEAAQEEHGKEDPFHEEVVLDTDDNVTISEEDRRRFFDGMGEEEEQVRRHGAFLIQSGLVYREWNKEIHLVDPYKIPEDWTVYDFLDPGHANAFAILFAAVKPDGDIVLFDEIYVNRMDIPDVVSLWHKKLSGHSTPLGGLPHWSQRTAIDPASNIVQAGMKMNSVRVQLMKERVRRNFRSFEGEYKLFNAPNAVQAGIFAVQALLLPRPDKGGRPRLTVMRHLIHFQREIRRYRYPRAPDGKDVSEKVGPIKKSDHLMDVLRYLALMNPQYVPPQRRPEWAKGATGLMKRLKDRKAAQHNRAETEATNCL